MPIPFDSVARLPIPQDNIAIATKLLPAGTEIAYQDYILSLPYTVLLGHRFAVQDVPEGEALYSWGQTFGIATKHIYAGDSVCNADVLQELRRRSLDVDLPDEANFRNDLEHYQFNATTFQPANPLPRHADVKTFMGYLRPDGRGVGTRNMIILLGVNSLVAGFVRKLEAQLQHQPEKYPNIDGIVAVAHTESGQGNNQALLHRTLEGFLRHPNVGAALIVDYGHTMMLDCPVLHHVMHLSDSFDADLAEGTRIVTSWLEIVNNMERTPQPLSELKIALQCGGSDAFSGISGNPLAAWVAKEVIQYGGCANLAETDELIGAETYVLDKVRDSATAEKFLSFVERFKKRVGWHGHSAEGNPSGGNKFRGLYNIYLKSLGAATKRHPDVRLDYVIDYSEHMQQPGYYFMDSPGNDLESVAGQVASGCNMIFFVTGNGSITNFPFVPTIKIVTTTERYQLLSNEMDINAGAYLDGTPLPELGAQTLQYTIDIASGQLSIGEKAGHSQVQIWRDWQFTHPIELEPLRNQTFSGQPIPLDTSGVDVPPVTIPMYKHDGILSSRLYNLILPTSLCSGQIARMCVESLKGNFVTLVHTEGCGGSVNEEFKDTLLGYLAHPFVKNALLLEHGCEATHNDYFRHAMRARGLDPQDYGWASIQLDGGIQSVIHKMQNWFNDQPNPEPKIIQAGLEAVRVGIVSSHPMLDTLAQMIVKAGGTVIMSEHGQAHYPTLGYAEVPNQAGLHVMAMPTRDWSEILTGLGAAGVDIILSYVDALPMPAHPMIPVLQVSDTPHPHIDVHEASALLDTVIATLSREYTPKAMQSGNINFQVTRGLLGVSL